ncbi:MAG: hypothetical protein H7Y30_15235 [Pyrinomonadaceae bacterium]|nr:hypothetical protein [Pyrinomonadaceae bacterium]
MTDEERQRQMDFIVNHQAELTVKMDKAEVRITRLENVLKLAIRAGLRERKETREKINILIDSHVRLAEAQARTEAAVARMADAQAQTDAALAKLAGSQTHTDERLDALIEIVRKERNGNSDSNGEPSAKG